MEGHAQKCGERFCELAHKTVDQLQEVSTPCFDEPPSKTRISRNGGRVFRDLLPDCIKMLVFWQELETRSTLDNK